MNRRDFMQVAAVAGAAVAGAGAAADPKTAAPAAMAPVAPGKHEAVPLPFDPKKLSGISEKLIVSHHDFARTPPLEALLAIVDRCHAVSGAIAKIATAVSGEEDRRTLLALLAQRPERTCVIGMGASALLMIAAGRSATATRSRPRPSRDIKASVPARTRLSLRHASRAGHDPRRLRHGAARVQRPAALAWVGVGWRRCRR